MPIIKKLAVILITTCLLSACGSTIDVKKPIDLSNRSSVKYRINPMSHDKIINRNVDEDLLYKINDIVTRKLMRKRMIQTNPKESAYDVDIDVTRYRVKNGFIRFITGPISGMEYIDTVVTVKNPSGKVIGEATIHSYNLSEFRKLKKKHSKSLAKFLAGETD